MINLNEILEPIIQREWCREVSATVSKKIRPEVEWKLDKKLPQCYDLTCRLREAIAHLAGEVNDNTKAVKRRVKTYQEGDKQLIELAWGGEPLTKDRLADINRRYGGNANRKADERYSGSFRAGDIILEMGGRLWIENFSDGVYSIRNVIEIPLPKRVRRRT